MKKPNSKLPLNIGAFLVRKWGEPHRPHPAGELGYRYIHLSQFQSNHDYQSTKQGVGKFLKMHFE